jgi:hypothetical protein
MKLVQVDPQDAVKVYVKDAEYPPQELMERVLNRFMESGLKCCRIEDDYYRPEPIGRTLSSIIRHRQLGDQVMIRKNLSKIYLVRK